MLDGAISVDSIVGEWTKFVVEFPLTVSLDSKETIASKLAGRAVWLVSDSDTESRHLIKTCEHFNVEYLHYGSIQELNANLGSSTRASGVCVVQEDLYDDSAYASLSRRTGAVLVTYGPKGVKDRGLNHYRSLTRLFPTVLVQELGSMFEPASKPGAIETNMIANANMDADVASPPPEDTPKVSFEGLKILVTDDNENNRKVMARMLERVGVTEVKLAENGKIATELAAEESFDAIFMDMQMPVMDGLEACKIITKRRNGPKQKVIFLTAYTSDEFEFQCAESGAVDYLTKPCTIGDVRAVLEKIVMSK